MTATDADVELRARLRDRAERALRERWPAVELGHLQPLPGGISSLTFAAAIERPAQDRRRVVVKVAPPGLEPVRNRDVLRQARALVALHGAPGVPVPRVLAADAGMPPLFVMEHVDGDSYEPRWDAAADAPGPELVRTRALAAARTLAALHAVDPWRSGPAARAAGAGIAGPAGAAARAADPGDAPAGTPEAAWLPAFAGERALTAREELDRWTALYATVGAELCGGEAELREALRESVPEPEPGARPVVVHGDFRLGNLLFQGGRPAALIDWETWTLGDRRHDLAWLLMFADPVMERAPRRGPADLAAGAAMPPAGELLHEYLRATGASEPPDDLAWFVAASRYKLGSALAALIKRGRRGRRPDPGLERAALTTEAALRRGLSELRSAALSRRGAG